MRVVLVLMLGLAALAAPTADAHAFLEEAAPLPDARLEPGLTTLTARFSERVAPEWSSLDVFALDGSSVLAGPSRFVSPTMAEAALTPLSNGTYSVAWATLSHDAHVTRGVHFIYVGEEAPRLSAPVAASEPLSIPEIVTRALLVAGAVTAFALPLVARRREGRPRARSLHFGGALALLGAASAALLLWYLKARTGTYWPGAVTYAPGTALALTGGLLLAAGLLAPLAAALSTRPVLAALQAALAGAALVGVAFTSPDGAASGWFRPLMAFAFLMAAGACLGAVLAGNARRAALRSGAGITAAAAFVTLTLYSPPAAAFLVSATATALFVAAAALALTRPRTPALAAILVAGLLASGLAQALPPPDITPPVAAARERFSLDATTETSHIVFQVDPAPPRVGVAGLTVIVHPLTRGGLPAETTVMLSVISPGSDEARPMPAPTQSGPGEWRLSDVVFDRPGPWQVLVGLERPDESTTIPFPFIVQGDQP